MTHRQYFKAFNPLIAFPPAVYCPANGYILDPGAPYVPPVDMGTPTTEEIRLLCTNNTPGLLTVRVTTSTAVQYYAQIYDSTGNTLIATTPNVNSNNPLTYFFPTTPTDSLFIVKIKPVSGSITVFKTDTYSGYTKDWQILQARFNTPNIITLTSAFESIKTIMSVIFDCTLNYLTSLQAIFRYAGILNFTFPNSLPELTDATNVFYQSNISRMIWASNATAPKLTNISGMFQLTKNVISVSFPTSLPELVSFTNLFRTSNIQQITLFTSAPKSGANTFVFYDTPNLRGEIVLPEMPLCTGVTSFFNINGGITKIKFQGTMNGTFADGQRFYDVAREMTSLVEFEFPREMSTWTNSTCFSVDRKSVV